LEKYSPLHHSHTCLKTVI